MKYGIVVDSGCDIKYLSEETKGKIDFSRAPLTLDIGEKLYVDTIDLDVESYMKEMYDFKGKTGSAAPSPDAYYQAFLKSKYILVITVTSTLSGSYISARTAKEIFLKDFPDRKIHLIDSKSAGPQMSLLVHKLIELIEKGLSYDQIIAEIASYQKKTHLLFILESLDNLVKNGRVSKLKARMAGILGIKIIGEANKEGNLSLLDQCRGKKAPFDRILNFMQGNDYHGGQVIITHCFNNDGACSLAVYLRSRHPTCNITIMQTSGLCSYYAEQGGLLIGFES